MLSVIIPSYNEQNYIAACLAALRDQTHLPERHDIQIIVAANGCRDRTVEVAESFRDSLEAEGFHFLVLDLEQGNKMLALNTAETRAMYENRAYLDADVILSPRVLSELIPLLEQEGPVYASGRVVVPPSPNWITRAYAKIWTRMPFVRDGVPGIGLYAMNAAGRARWGAFPPIIGDDRFVRLNFSPEERRKTRASYLWPLPDGFWNLVKVRRRWTEGNDELARNFPELLENDSEQNARLGNLGVLFRHPLSGTIFMAVHIVAKLRARLGNRGEGVGWRRGRA